MKLMTVKELLALTQRLPGNYHAEAMAAMSGPFSSGNYGPDNPLPFMTVTYAQSVLTKTQNESSDDSFTLSLMSIPAWLIHTGNPNALADEEGRNTLLAFHHRHNEQLNVELFWLMESNEFEIMNPPDELDEKSLCPVYVLKRDFGMIESCIKAGWNDLLKDKCAKSRNHLTRVK